MPPKKVRLFGYPEKKESKPTTTTNNPVRLVPENQQERAVGYRKRR
jgi:hypothetical protein